MADDTYYMRQALQEAREAANRGEVPVGAVVVCRDSIIARAHNLTETLTDVTAHAEMQAITAAAGWLGGKYLNDCTLYVTVEPCVMCAGALRGHRPDGWSMVPMMKNEVSSAMLPRLCILRHRSPAVCWQTSAHNS